MQYIIYKWAWTSDCLHTGKDWVEAVTHAAPDTAPGSLPYHKQSQADS